MQTRERRVMVSTDSTTRAARTRAALATLVTFLALVASMAAVPTAQAHDAAGTLAGRRVATKFKRVGWPDNPAVYGTPTYVDGKIKSRSDKHRVVMLQMKLPTGWVKVDKDKTNG